jgi:hypothetical protein
MSFRSLFLACVSLGLLSAADPGLTTIRHIYILPMGGGLDQYLANRLTRSGRYVVVTDAEQADALFTDQVGADFEERMLTLYPPPPPPETKEEPKEEAESKTAEPANEPSMVAMMSGAIGKTRIVSSFSRSHGNVFLVDRASKRVVWSTFLRPRSRVPEEMDHAAEDIVDRLDDAADHQVKQIQKSEKAANSATPAPVSAPPSK